ncbi:MAG TPA: amidophosphoribosyltransferase [Spirochaetia bacterium]|nr:amidophosphoribosyltransferase [Spirochaetia bacterium]
MAKSLGHHCGVVGVHSKTEKPIPEMLFYGLFSLQHRGQESAGIAYRKPQEIVVYKDLGMVSTVLSRYLEETRLSNIGIGHVRYSTHGGNRIENAQPMLVNCNKGKIALAHNGNISNTKSIKSKLEEEGSIFQSTSDSELMLHLIARSRKPDFREALKETLGLVEGAYSMVMIHDNSLIAVRDPKGFRPLYIGTKDDLTVVASETCALDILQVKEYRSIAPGEMITIDENGMVSEHFASSPRISQCVFELIYFARPDSYVFDRSVHLMRKRMGAALAECDAMRGDIVVPVPDSGNSAALGYAEASGIPFEQGLQRNHYAGRSFIMPTTAQREFAVRMKLHPVRSVIQGKSVILIDDSLVRGTTSRTLVKLMKEAGAKEVHLRLTSPELKYPCYFGIDIPTRGELISNSKNPKEIAKFIGADSVIFLPIDKLRECVESPNDYCFACFSGAYPIDIHESLEEE